MLTRNRKYPQRKPYGILQTRCCLVFNEIFDIETKYLNKLASQNIITNISLSAAGTIAAINDIKIILQQVRKIPRFGHQGMKTSNYIPFGQSFENPVRFRLYTEVCLSPIFYSGSQKPKNKKGISLLQLIIPQYHSHLIS